MQSARVLVTNRDQESAQKGALLGLGLPGGQLGGAAPPPGVEGFPLGDVLLCVTLTVPLQNKTKNDPGQEGHEMSGMGLCWATWPGACKPERWMLRGQLLFCPETVLASGRGEGGPEVWSDQRLEAPSQEEGKQAEHLGETSCQEKLNYKDNGSCI